MPAEPAQPADSAQPAQPADSVEHWLVEAQRRGYLGPGPLESMTEHSLGFADVVEEVLGGPPAELLDMGSGGGVPGLVMAARWSEARVTLVEGSTRRGAFLVEVTRGLGWADDGRVQVVIQRAEELGRDPGWREQAGLVVARLFGTPPVTAECAAPLLRVGGALVVSEPPDPAPGGDSRSRWPADALQPLGLEPAEVVRRRGFGYQVVRKVAPTPERFPRRVGTPAKRPLY